MRLTQHKIGPTICFPALAALCAGDCDKAPTSPISKKLGRGWNMEQSAATLMYRATWITSPVGK